MSSLFKASFLPEKDSKGSTLSNNKPWWFLGGEYFIGACRTLVHAKLKNVQTGSLTIRETCIGTQEFGNAKTKPNVEIRVQNSSFWPRLMFFGAMGFAEAYMDGIISCSNIADVLELLIINRNTTSDYNTLSSWTLSLASGLYRATNSLTVSRSNVALHYDLSNALFAAFLSPNMTYSCPIWCSPTEPLETAQKNKLLTIIKDARLKPTDHVLEIGTGWGSFAILAVKTTGCTVTSITLSSEQKEEAEMRIAKAGMSDKIEARLQDYREVKGKFDKIVSIEMIEHVGKENLAEYFGTVDRLLDGKKGIAVFQSSTMPDTRFEAYCKGDDFIRKHIFPGANVPAVSHIVASIQKGSSGNLILDKLENIGGHYVKALKTWRENFQQNFEKLIRPELLRRNPEVDVEVFARKWEYYFAICEAGFKTKTLGCAMFTVGREGNSEMIEDVLKECREF